MCCAPGFSKIISVSKLPVAAPVAIMSEPREISRESVPSSLEVTPQNLRSLVREWESKQTTETVKTKLRTHEVQGILKVIAFCQRHKERGLTDRSSLILIDTGTGETCRLLFFA
jgi:hypothetical protein